MSRAKYGRSTLPAFNDALMNAHASDKAPQPACEGRPGDFVDYEADTPSELPSMQRAEALCAPCPLVDLCLENAKRVKPQWGILGGAVWVYGRRADTLTEEELRIRLDTFDRDV